MHINAKIIENLSSSAIEELRLPLRPVVVRPQYHSNPLYFIKYKGIQFTVHERQVLGTQVESDTGRGPLPYVDGTYYIVDPSVLAVLPHRTDILSIGMKYTAGVRRQSSCFYGNKIGGI